MDRARRHRATNGLLTAVVLATIVAAGCSDGGDREQSFEPVPFAVQRLDFEQGLYASPPLNPTYEVSTDGAVRHGGNASGRIRSTRPPLDEEDFGSLPTCVSADGIAGGTLRYSGWLEGVTGYAGLWARADATGDSTSKTLAFDNMQDRNLTGSRELGFHRIELRLPRSANGLCFGFLLVGEGTVWADDLVLEHACPEEGCGAL